MGMNLNPDLLRVSIYDHRSEEHQAILLNDLIIEL